MRQIKLLNLAAALAVLSLLFVSTAKTNALEVPPSPRSGYVVDNAEILTEQEESELNQQIQTLKDQSTNEIGILTIKDGEGIDPAAFSVELGRTWGVGTKENKNGVVILVSLSNPKRIQIAVSTGLEGVLTDALSGQISRNEISPKFKESKYYDGLSAGVLAISQATKGEYQVSNQTKYQEPVKNALDSFAFLVFVLIMVQFIVGILSSTKSWWAGGIFGAFASIILAAISGSFLALLISFPLLVGLGLLLDYKISKNYKKHLEKRKDDKTHIIPWYFGGGGGSGGGFSGGGGGGGFSGGGSFGGGGGGSSW